MCGLGQASILGLQEKKTNFYKCSNGWLVAEVPFFFVKQPPSQNETKSTAAHSAVTCYAQSWVSAVEMHASLSADVLEPYFPKGHAEDEELLQTKVRRCS